MIRRMRIDASNLLLAGQVQAKRQDAPVKAQSGFEPLDFAKPAAGAGRKAPTDTGADVRLGTRLDIKV